MTDLRAKRKEETAILIQKATVKLAQIHGFDSVTTDMISQETGISPRTFFNYFANKEAALLGKTPYLTDETAAILVPGSGVLRDDLRRLFHALTCHAPQRQSELSIIVPALRTQPRMLEVYITRRAQMSERLAALLATRMPDHSPTFRSILAELIMNASWSCITQWLSDKGPIESVAQDGWQAIEDIARLLAPPES